MSISSVFFILCCVGIYRLGAFNARHPGRAWCCCCDSTLRFWKWLNQ